METVTIQCGACGQVIAVSKEHLGQQVQCPLCGAVIEAPAPEPFPIPVLPTMRSDEDSIFAPPEEEQDIFGRPEKGPEVQMPSGTALLPGALEPQVYTDDRTENLQPDERFRSAPGDDATQALEGDPQEAATLMERGREPRSELPAITPSRRYSSRGSWSAIIMIFLIPYSIVLTFAVIYLIYQRSQLGLDRLPDPDSKDGAPVRIRHNAPLPDRQKTELQKEIQIGDLRVTPLKVERTAENDLILHLKMENTSDDVAFNPFPDVYCRFAETRNKPYTYLEADPPIYGGYTARYRQPAGARDEKDNGTFSGIIGPNEIVYTQLLTYDKEDVRSSISRLIAAGKPVLWRIQVRRGLVSFKGRNVSATAVIGVEFPPSAIEKTG